MRRFVLSASFLVLACGGDVATGIDRDKRANDLSVDEVRELCVLSVEAQGGDDATHDCGDGATV